MMNSSLVQQIVAIEPFGSLVIGLTKLVPYILVIGAFSATYILIPHTNVKWRSALLGGLVAGVLWETVGWGFASFIVGSAKYEAVYSGFAILILFLFWLYLNWLVLLLGASIAFYHQNPAYQTSGAIHKPLGNRAKELLALEILRLIGKAYQDGDRQWTLENLLEDISLPMESVNEVLQKLLSRKLLVNAGEEPGYFVPGRDLQTITIKEVLDVVRDDFEGNGSNKEFSDSSVVSILDELDSLAGHQLENKTIKDLIS
jgi:membrane protein